MKKLLVLLLGLTGILGFLLTGCGSDTPAPAQTPEASSPAPIEAPLVGNLAPGFTLDYLGGETVSLSDFRGSPVLINFWATWCGPCRYEMPFLQQIYDDWTDKGLVVLTVDIAENHDTVEGFMQELDLSLPVLMDRDQAVTKRYNVRNIPATFLIDKNGIIQSIRIGAFTSPAEIEEELSKIMP